MYLFVLFRALWLLAVWLVYAIAPDFLLLFFSLALLPFQPKAQPPISSWLFLDDANIIQLSIIHLFILGELVTPNLKPARRCPLTLSYSIEALALCLSKSRAL